jgi:hypothetical protein
MKALLALEACLMFLCATAYVAHLMRNVSSEV